MKKNLRESLAKMKYHAGIISESQYLKEFEGLEEPTDEKNKFQSGKHFQDEQAGFSPESEEDVNALFHALTKEGVTDLSFYPEWVFKALQEDNYVQQEEGTGAWFLSIEGQSIFRSPLKLQQYLITANETEVSPEDLGETQMNEIGDPKQMTGYYTQQLANVKPGTVEYAPAFKIESRGNGSDTKWIDLNAQSAEALVAWLTKNFLNKV